MLKRISDSNWKEAFAYCANETRAGGGSGCGPQPTQGYTGSCAPFDREDVAEILAIEDGENDGASWEAVFRLKDGRYAFLSAGCDYTGWDCRADGSSRVAADLPSLIRWGLPAETRERLKLPLVNE